MRRRILLVLGAVVAASLGSAAPAVALTIGIADQKPDMFSDPRFLSTGLRHARIAVGWDAMDGICGSNRPPRKQRQMRLRPLITWRLKTNGNVFESKTESRAGAAR